MDVAFSWCTQASESSSTRARPAGSSFFPAPLAASKKNQGLAILAVARKPRDHAIVAMFRCMFLRGEICFAFQDEKGPLK